MDKLFSKQLSSDIIELSEQKDRHISYLTQKIEYLCDFIRAMTTHTQTYDIYPVECEHNRCPVIGSLEGPDTIETIYNLYRCGHEYRKKGCYKYDEWIDTPFCGKHMHEYGDACSNKECESVLKRRKTFYCRNHLCEHLKQQIEK